MRSPCSAMPVHTKSGEVNEHYHYDSESEQLLLWRWPEVGLLTERTLVKTTVYHAAETTKHHEVPLGCVPTQYLHERGWRGFFFLQTQKVTL